MKAALCASMWIFCIASGEGAVGQTLTPAKGDQVAALRLLTMPSLSEGRYLAGIEIAMAPGSHTYWKQPGEAGVPPVFAFNGSTNVAKAEVKFPVPTRISEDGIEAFGYVDRVVFPVEVKPADAAKPATLKVVIDYAVCNKICIPAHGTASVELRPAGDGLGAPAVKAALASVPVPLPAADAAKLKLAPIKGGGKPGWTVSWSGSPALDDVFPDAPEGFYFATRKTGPNQFTLTAEQVVSAAKTTQVPVSLTLSRKAGSFVAKEMLEVSGSTN